MVMPRSELQYVDVPCVVPTDHIMISVPPPIQKYSESLIRFFEAMVQKLAKNAHKNTPGKCDIPEILRLLRAEIVEFEIQFKHNKSDDNSLYELADTSNYAFLAYVALREAGVLP
jgi:hypothetical protein